jgi:8-oxo-dGTP pyrophosphatase MutT (NUDIX family)
VLRVTSGAAHAGIPIDSVRQWRLMHEGSRVLEGAAGWIGDRLNLARIRAELADFAPRLLPDPDSGRRAAVAMVLRSGDTGPELLLIHRADDPRDPWSGHMGLPGGRVDPGDAGCLEAAMREAREEVALDLDRAARSIGRLSDLEAVAGGRPVQMVISVFAFELVHEVTLQLNQEVQAALWVPLAFLADRSNRSTLRWKRSGMPVPLPCYRYRGRTIWGLTLRMVDELLELLARTRPRW